MSSAWTSEGPWDGRRHGAVDRPANRPGDCSRRRFGHLRVRTWGKHECCSSRRCDLPGKRGGKTGRATVRIGDLPAAKARDGRACCTAKAKAYRLRWTDDRPEDKVQDVNIGRAIAFPAIGGRKNNGARIT